MWYIANYIPQFFVGRTSVPTCLLYTTIIRWPNIVCLPVCYNTTVIDWPNIVCLPVCYNTTIIHWPNLACLPVCYNTTVTDWPNIVCLPVCYNTTIIHWPNIACLPVCCNTKVLHWPNRVYIPVCCISNHIRFFQNGVVHRCHFVGKPKQHLPCLKRKIPVNHRLCLKGEASYFFCLESKRHLLAVSEK